MTLLSQQFVCGVLAPDNCYKVHRVAVADPLAKHLLFVCESSPAQCYQFLKKAVADLTWVQSKEIATRYDYFEVDNVMYHSAHTWCSHPSPQSTILDWKEKELQCICEPASNV